MPGMPPPLQILLLDDIDTLFLELAKLQDENDNLRAEIITLEDNAGKEVEVDYRF